MGVSALRVTACAGVLVGGLALGAGVIAPASGDPGGAGLVRGDGQSGEDAVGVRIGRHHAIIHRSGELHRLHRVDQSTSPATTFSTAQDSVVAASEPTASTFNDATEPPAPEVAPGDDRAAAPDGTDVGTEGAVPGTETHQPDIAEGDADSLGNAEVSGDGSDHAEDTVATDNAEAVSADPAPAPEAVETSTGVVVDYPYLYYLLQVRRGGGTWWNATKIVSRLEQIISPPAPEPEPGPSVAAPAFRGPAPEAPAPEPVIDVSGGVRGGGSDYQPTDFGGAPVLTAPVIAVPVLPAAAVRFPSATTGGALGADPGPGAARGVGVELGAPSSAVRTDATQPAPPAVTLKSMSAETPRQQGYTDYLRSPGLPQMAGAAAPGVAGILLMTFGGGIIGYRQAKAGRMVRMTSAARYLP